MDSAYLFSDSFGYISVVMFIGLTYNRNDFSIILDHLVIKLSKLVHYNILIVKHIKAQTLQCI